MGIIRVVEAIDNNNISGDKAQIADMMLTIPIGMAMMNLQNAFTKILDNDVSTITDDSTKWPDDPSRRSAQLQKDELNYQLDSTRMDSSTSQFRTLFDTSKQQVTSDVESQKNIVQLDDSVNSVMSTSANLVQRGSSYGKA
ncbi:hypothetical protein [Simkania negevensis]|uniref:Uncharacterized protein n=1 Tax=Simkania negevensis (strain ATCC VR-1471 / DSM 27360 / Z) TaxID=331113 RepID=F8L3I5_SIMNZ|nr:hypothetical protein [Simkania negevensis]CCB89844.1 unknown protein [Simkania negevensis Z]